MEENTRSQVAGAPIVNTDVPLKMKQGLTYSSYALGSQMLQMWLNAFLMIFLTDSVGVPAVAVAALLMFTRFWDAGIDPVLGVIQDRTRLKMGRYKPWVLIGGIGFSICVAMFFANNPSWSIGAKTSWMWAFYILVVTFQSIAAMSYASLGNVLTSNIEGRIRLQTLRLVTGGVGNNITNIVAVPLIALLGGVVISDGGQSAQGYFWSVFIFAVIMLPFVFLTAFKSKEIITIQMEQVKVKFAKQMASLFKNPYMIIVIVIFVLQGFMAYGRFSMLMYYFRYAAGNAGLMSIQGFVALAGTLLAIPVGPWVYKRLKSKNVSIQVVGVTNCACYVALFFTNPGAASSTAFLFWVFFFLVQFLDHCMAGYLYSLFGDCADYSELKNGFRSDSLLNGATSFAMQVGGAIGPAVILLIVDNLGFVPNAAEQPAAVISMMGASISLLPGICMLIYAVLIIFYKLTGEKMKEIVAELDKRRSEALTENK